MACSKSFQATRNITIVNIAAGLLLVPSLVALCVTQFVLKHKPNGEKTKDLLIKVCTSSLSDEATIAAHSMQLLETKASDLLLYSIYAIAIIVTIAVNAIKNKAQACLLCLNILTLLNILCVEHSIANVFKAYEGEPRPFILSVCKLPDKILESDDCVETVKNFEGDIFENLLEETREGYCTPKVARSHPSGHSSTAWALATFSAIQLIIFAIPRFKQLRESKPKVIRFLLLISLMILLVSFLAFQVMNGRVQEHFHTWRNCLSGMAIGIASSLVLSIPFTYLQLQPDF
ncbi:MAG: hypothetical protein MHMPM18_003381 [Marteilia pararefringens]